MESYIVILQILNKILEEIIIGDDRTQDNLRSLQSNIQDLIVQFIEDRTASEGK